MDFLLRIHVTKMLQGIYISLRSAGNLFSGLRPRIFVFKIFQSPPPPPLLIKKWNGPSFTLNSKVAQRWGRGLGGVNRVWLPTLSYFPPTELSNS